MKKRVLLVEDDDTIARVLKDMLVFEGLEAESVKTGRAASTRVSAFDPDLVILDIGLPDVSGFELCVRLRVRRRIPIIMLTARGQKGDKIRGFQSGADDYVTKPFDLDELLARVHAVLRRGPADGDKLTLDKLTIGEVIIDLAAKSVTKRAQPLNLTSREFQLLRYLVERRGQVVRRDELLRQVWGYTESPLSRPVDHAIARLRSKLEDNPHAPRFIQSVYGDGYSFAVE